MRLSLPHRIAQAIEKDYLKQKAPLPEGRLPSVRTLEERFEVSRSTVLGALALLEQRGQIIRRHGQGCFAADPDSAARPGPRPDLLGFLSPSSESELMLRIYTGIEQAARACDAHVMVASSCMDYEQEKLETERMVRAGCGALLLSPVWRTQKQYAADYLKGLNLQIPLVLIDLAYPEQGRFRVVFDNRKTGYDTTQMLLREGHRRIAFCETFSEGEPACYYSIEERFKGFCEALAQEKLLFKERDRWRLEASAPNSTENWLDLWLRSEERPTAVIAIDDMVAMEIILQARKRGIKVPEELAVAGFDNRTAARSFRPAFPTTDPDFRQAGEVAARMALAMMRGEAMEPATYLLPAPILQRRGHQPEASSLP